MAKMDKIDFLAPVGIKLDGWPSYSIKTADGHNRCDIMANGSTTRTVAGLDVESYSDYGKLIFDQYYYEGKNEGQELPSGEINWEVSGKYQERYMLPTPTYAGGDYDKDNKEITQKWYNILTTKNPVTIAQGGTGKNTAAGANAALTRLTDTISLSGNLDNLDTLSSYGISTFFVGNEDYSWEEHNRPGNADYFSVLNVAGKNGELLQIAKKAPDGNLYHRGAHAGCKEELNCGHRLPDPLWVQILDEKNFDDFCKNKTTETTFGKRVVAAGFKTAGTVEAATFNAKSDARLKENIVPYTNSKSILDLPVYKFDYINGEKNKIGCLAQDLQKICPELVHENADGYLSIEENKLVYLLLEEVANLKSQLAKINRGD